jgi:hypothetical protein
VRRGILCVCLSASPAHADFARFCLHDQQDQDEAEEQAEADKRTKAIQFFNPLLQNNDTDAAGDQTQLSSNPLMQLQTEASAPGGPGAGGDAGVEMQSMGMAGMGGTDGGVPLSPSV